MIANGMRKWLACVVTSAFVLVACGGGSGNNVAGIDRTGAPVIASYGTVSAFGSVVVNGVHFDTTQASVTIDGATGAVTDLAIGDVVLVKGTLNSNGTTGVATSVSFQTEVAGPISSLNTAGASFVVLGRLVHVTADTSFDAGIAPAALATLAVNDVVEVSGLVRADDSIDATRIARLPAGADYQASGVAANAQPTLHSFAIGPLSVTYSSAVVSGIAGGIVNNGQRVRVRGTLAGGVFVASRVSADQNQLAGASGERRDVEGVITRFASATDFDVSGLTVTTNGQTAFEDGSAADLGLAVKVEAEGTLNGSGVLVASKIEVKRAASSRLAATVDSVNAAGASFVVLGVTFKVDAMTRLEDQSSLQVRPFSLANLAVGDFVEVRGTESPVGSRQALATLVERHNPQSLVQLTGFIESVTPPNFTVLGIAINASGAQFEGVNGVGNLKAGDLVQVTGQKVGDRAVTATKVEVDD
jgi:hypothetical protein